MGTPGVPWTVTKAQILESIKKQYGRITYVAKELDCAWITVKLRIDADEELTKALADARNGFDAELVERAESSLMRGLNEPDPNAYLKTAMYILNNKGRDRGYNHPEAQKQVFTLVEVKEKLKDGKLVQS